MTIINNGLGWTGDYEWQKPAVNTDWYQPYTLTWPDSYRCPNCKCKNCSPKIYSKEELEEAIKKAVEEYVAKTSKKE